MEIFITNHSLQEGFIILLYSIKWTFFKYSTTINPILNIFFNYSIFLKVEASRNNNIEYTYMAHFNVQNIL